MAKCGKGQIWNKKLSKCVVSSRSKAKQELKKEDPKFMSKESRKKAGVKGAKLGAVAGGSAAFSYGSMDKPGERVEHPLYEEGHKVRGKSPYFINFPKQTTPGSLRVPQGVLGTMAGAGVGYVAGKGVKRLGEEYKIQKRARKIRKKRRKKGNK